MLRIFLVLLVGAMAPVAAAQNTYWVSSAAATGPGTLRTAIESMQFNGTTQTIRFALTPNSSITLAAPLPNLVGTQVEVIGSDTANLLIDGAQFPIFKYNGQSLLMRDLVLANGRGSGGGCLNVNTTLSASVYDSHFLNCSTFGSAASGSSGGAIRSFGALRLTRTRFTNNMATDGGIDNLSLGGGAVGVSGALLIENSQFSGNRLVRTEHAGGGCFDGVGGAVSLTLNSGSATIIRSTFRDNEIRCGSTVGAFSGSAGALFVIGPASGPAPTLLIESSYFGGNRADNGGGIFARAVSLLINNSSFYEQVGRGAGAVFLTTGFGAAPPAPELRLSSSTFWRNGTALGNFGADLTMNAAVLVRDFRNNLFAPPQSGFSCAPAAFNADTGAVSFTTDLSCLVTVNGNLVTAQFASGNSFGLLPPTPASATPILNLGAGSVAIDNGSNLGCPALDALGRPRPYDGDQDGNPVCDVGAVEYRPDLLMANGFEG
jgi:hypothetical protein